MNKMITKLEKSPNVHTIKMPECGRFNSVTCDKNKAINIVPQRSVVGYDPSNNKTSAEERRNPRVGLSHELQRLFDVDNGNYSDAKTENGIPLMEINAINTENKVRKNTGDQKRLKYGN